MFRFSYQVSNDDSMTIILDALLFLENKNFDEIKLATYRAAAKLYFVQKATYCKSRLLEFLFHWFLYFNVWTVALHFRVHSHCYLQCHIFFFFMHPSLPFLFPIINQITPSNHCVVPGFCFFITSLFAINLFSSGSSMLPHKFLKSFVSHLAYSIITFWLWPFIL